MDSIGKKITLKVEGGGEMRIMGVLIKMLLVKNLYIFAYLKNNYQNK